MHSYRFRCATARAYIMAAFLALLSLLVIAPHAHASGHLHHHHRARVSIDMRTGAIERDPFGFASSLFRPPVTVAQAGVEQAIATAGAVPGRLARSTSEVLREASRFVGHRNPTRFRGPWCAAFLNMVLARTGHRHALSMRAIDALRDGYRVSHPRPGDIVVLGFGHRHHVTFFASWGGRGFYGLGGNQSRRVKLSSYPLNRVIAFVRPT